MFLFGVFCNNFNIEKRDGEYVFDGDLIEGVLFIVVRKGGFLKEFVDLYYWVIEEFLFDLVWKMMIVIVED